MSTQVDLFDTVEPTSVRPAIAKPMLWAGGFKGTYPHSTK